jgi:hypothetical protein
LENTISNFFYRKFNPFEVFEQQRCSVQRPKTLCTSWRGFEPTIFRSGGGRNDHCVTPPGLYGDISTFGNIVIKERMWAANFIPSVRYFTPRVRHFIPKVKYSYQGADLCGKLSSGALNALGAQKDPLGDSDLFY